MTDEGARAVRRLTSLTSLDIVACRTPPAGLWGPHREAVQLVTGLELRHHAVLAAIGRALRRRCELRHGAAHRQRARHHRAAAAQRARDAERRTAERGDGAVELGGEAAAGTDTPNSLHGCRGARVGELRTHIPSTPIITPSRRHLHDEGELRRSQLPHRRLRPHNTTSTAQDHPWLGVVGAQDARRHGGAETPGRRGVRTRRGGRGAPR